MANGMSLSTAPQPALDDRNKFWSRELLLGLLPLLIGFQLIAWIVYLPISLHGLADFRTLYASAYMTRLHHGGEIYDAAALLRYKEQVAPLGRPFLQPMDHPAYETLLFLPLTYLNYRSAFLVFAAINLGTLLVCVWLLLPSLRVLSERWKPLPVLLFFAFFPVTRAITQGQDSIVLLALLAGAFVLIRHDQDFAAGLLVGAGLFKLQIVIPIALLFLIWKRWRFASGFAASAAVALLTSFLLVGKSGARQYASILLGMSVNLRTQADAVRSSVSPLTMLNLRGVLSAILDGHLGHWWVQGLIVAASLSVVLFAARCHPSMPLAIVSAALVSYHLNVQDASMLMIPAGLCLCSQSRWVALTAISVFILPIAAVVPIFGFVGGFAILSLFIGGMRFGQRSFESGARDASQPN